MLLSVITINLNNLPGLTKTYESVVSQKCKSFEWIVIDGGSTDGSKEFLEKISGDITYWVSEKDNGIYHAMNKGVDAAKGDYLIFINSGDILYDDGVTRDFCDRDNYEEVICGRQIIIDGDGNRLWMSKLPPEPLRLSYIWRCGIRHQATFFHKRCFESYRYNEGHRINSDFELCLQLYYAKFVFGRYDRVVAGFDSTGISTRMLGSKLYNDEFDESINNALPVGMVSDYKELVYFQESEALQRVVSVFKTSKISRYCMKICILLIYHMSKLVNRRI